MLIYWWFLITDTEVLHAPVTGGGWLPWGLVGSGISVPWPHRPLSHAPGSCFSFQGVRMDLTV